MNTLLNFTKRIASIFLGMAFFLPLSQCSPKQIPPESSHSVPYDITAYSAHELFSLAGVLTLLAFFWPLLVQCLLWLRTIKLRDTVWPIVTELMMCVLSGLWILLLTMWSTSIRYGSFVAGGALLLYFGALVAELSPFRRPNLNRSGSLPMK